MTETLGLTPSQTIGPYLSIGLLREIVVPTTLVDPGDPERSGSGAPARRRRRRRSPTG